MKQKMFGCKICHGINKTMVLGLYRDGEATNACHVSIYVIRVTVSDTIFLRDVINIHVGD